MHNRFLFIAILLLLLASCKVTQPYKSPAAFANNNLYRDTVDNTVKPVQPDTTTLATIPWRQMFNDTLLQALIQEGIDSNLDLKIAVSRIKQSQANLRQSKAAYFPKLNANAQATLQNPPPQSQMSSQQYEGFLSSSWEIGLWGQLKNAQSAQLALLLQSDAYQKAVQTQLVANIVSNYYSLMAYDEQLKVTIATVENRKIDVTTTQALKEGDVLTGAAVVQSQANVFSAEVTIPDIKQSIRETENAINILLARNPGPLKRDSLENQKVATDLRTGIPLQLLSNRPDVQEAEFQLRYAAAITNVARSFFYPSLTITAEGGVSANNISQLFNAPSILANIIGGLTQPIFNNGLNQQRLDVTKEQEVQSLIAFKQALLNAGNEVSNALYNYQAATEKIAIRAQEIFFLKKAVDFTRELMKYNENTNYTDVLTSEQNLLAAELNGINDRLQQLQAVVTLYSSLGGGWR